MAVVVSMFTILVLYLADYIEGWVHCGHDDALPTFGFKDMNRTIMDLTHGTGNVGIHWY